MRARRERREGGLLSGLQRRTADRYREKDQEPTCFPVFRWGLMLTGVILLLSVLVILCQLVVEFRQKYQEDEDSNQELSTEDPTEMPNQPTLN